MADTPVSQSTIQARAAEIIARELRKGTWRRADENAEAILAALFAARIYLTEADRAKQP